MQLPNNISSSLAFVAKLPQQKIAQMVAIILLGYIAYLSAELTWLIAAPENPTQQTFSSTTNQPRTEAKNTVDIAELKALNLFGNYTEKSARPVNQVSDEVKDAPETKLNLTLSGVVASNDKDIAVAVIENSGKQNTLGIGDKIEGTRAILEQVYFDRVIIKHAGKLETLMLDGIKYNKNVATSPSQAKVKTTSQSSSVVDNRNNQALSERVSDLKATIVGDPGKIIDYLRITPKMQNGETVGYLLMPGKNPEFFKASGLKSGDVAVQMNGFDLTSPLDAAQALQALKTEPEVALWVDRDGEVTEILFSIEN
ncbi:type II secretion system protein GspC [Thalassotalea agariperforans]